MVLIIGGAGQGKLDYALQKTGRTPADVAHTPEEALGKPIFAGLETWVREHPGAGLGRLLEENPGVVILCHEIGCGVVPLDPADRAWREETGRLCCALAARAERVERLFCGLPTVLKGEGTWN